ncbi:MAG: alkaline phosphatase family protein [Propionibacteriaceae bacterium]|jgi:hypothetical protein|nr:alkaline phosphatase family protein [Propionibacteriaceae bacterium]
MMAYVSEFQRMSPVGLSDLLPGVAHHVGASSGQIDRLGLPSASRYVIVVVDGLGWHITRRALMDAPYIAGIIGDAIDLTVGLPTTTATSLMSVWTGLPAGGHGVVGYSFARHDDRRGRTRVVKPLSEDEPIPVGDSLMSRMARDGVTVTWVMPEDLVTSCFTSLGAGLTRHGGAVDPTRPDTRNDSAATVRLIGRSLGDKAGRVEAVRQAAARGDRSVVYVYEPSLDHAGHKYGVRSDRWRAALTKVDDFLDDLRRALSDDVCLVITGDHGMVDPPLDQRVDIDQEPVLRRGVDLIGGEARFRHVYTTTPEAVARRWQDRLGDEAWVLSRADAMAQGWFGRVDPAFEKRIGDIVVMPVAGQAYLCHEFAGEYSLIGMHGAATDQERYVPLMID